MQYNLNSDQTLSDITIPLEQSAIIVSPTGSGKSYFVGKKLTQNRIMAVPTTALCQQFSKLYNASAYFSEEKNIDNKNFIVTTYHSLPKLIKELKDVSEYDLFVDEGHNLTAAANAEYMLHVLNDLVDLFPKFKRFFLLTATPLYNFHPIIKNLPVITVTRKSQTVKKYKHVVYADLFQTIKEITDDSKQNNRNFAILYNATKEKGKLAKMKVLLSDKNIAMINSTKKDHKTYEDVVVNGDLSELDGMIMTTVLKEGNSITKHSPNVDVIIVGEFHPIELEQVCARFRKAEQVNLFLLKSQKYEFNSFKYEKNAYKERVLDIATSLMTINSKIISLKEDMHTLMDMLSTYYGDLIHVKNNETCLNFLGMSNHLYTHDLNCLNKNVQELAFAMSEFDWEYCGVETNNNVLSEELNTNLNVEVEIIESVLVTKTENLIEAVGNSNPAENKHILETCLRLDKDERILRERVAYVNEFINNDTLHEAVDIVQNIANRSWYTFCNQINAQKIKHSKNSDNPYIKFIKYLYDNLFLNKKYESAELKRIIQEAMNKCGIVKRGLNLLKNDTRLTKFVSTLFVFKKLKKNNSDGKHLLQNPNNTTVFVFTNDNPTQFTTEQLLGQFKTNKTIELQVMQQVHF